MTDQLSLPTAAQRLPTQSSRAVAALILLAAALLAAHYADIQLNNLKLWGQSRFLFWPYMWAVSIIQLLAGVALWQLASWMSRRALPGWVSATYLVLGLVAALYAPLFWHLGLGRFRWPFFSGAQIGAFSLWSATGAALAIIGLALLFRRRG